MTHKLNYVSVILCFFILVSAISGCDKSTTDKNLKTHIASIRLERQQKKSGAKSTLTAPPSIASFNGGKLREPFISAGVKPQEIKPSSTLLNFSLSRLQFVGTITRNKSTYAYIVAPDNMVYQVKVGDDIGDQHGKVLHIFGDRIDVVEQELDGDKPPLKRLITLQLRKES